MKQSKIIILGALALYSSMYAQNVELGTITIEGANEEEILQTTLRKESTALAKNAKGETLGDFLQDEQFIDSASYGPAVGRPVVRGMDGYRVGVTNGNIILNDLSAMSQDHAVGVMARASERMELVKGPASLLYGNYSGGVIRVLGEEHDKKLLTQGYGLETVSNYGSNGSGLVLGGIVRVSDYNLSLYANTFYHQADTYHDGDGDEVKDTDTQSTQSHVVLGYQINAEHIVKMYVDNLNKDYGIPNSTAESTTIEMEQQRYGLVWHARNLFDVITHSQTEIEYSDYLHSELEAGRADGLFGQKQFGVSNMLEFDLGSWQTTTNIAYKNSDLQVCHEHGKCTHFFDADRTGAHVGEELEQNIAQFGLPFAHGHPMPNITESLMQAGIEMKKFITDDSELSVSLRGETRNIDPDNKNIQEVWLVTPAVDAHYYDSVTNSALSASLGGFTYFNDYLSLQASLGYVERLPSSTEMFWNGFHHATDSYIFGNRYIDNETSVNLDVDSMLEYGNWVTKLGGFYYHFYNYIYQAPLADEDGNLLIDPFHQSDVWAVKGVGARVFGMAFEERYKKEIGAHTITVSGSLEMIRGMLLKGSNLPRIPTYNATLFMEHAYKHYKANVTYHYVDESRFEAENETHTPGYSNVSALIGYDDINRYFEYSLYLKGENLTDEMAYNHLSFLKATAPLPGRQVSVGLEMKF